MASKTGTLYIVATPIGNLDDMSRRACRVLEDVNLVAAEDTRHSAKLLQHYGIRTRLLSLHEHNESERVPKLLARLAAGEDVALISDAGTPLISDPGYQLVRRAREEGFTVAAVPGPSALVAALSISGLPSDRFVFEGFLPAKSAARRRRLEALAQESRTLVFYESSHRILDSLGDMVAIFGATRAGVVARELTKQFETTRADSLAGLRDWVAADANQQKGEFVVLVHGFEAEMGTGPDPASVRMLEILATELPLKQAAALAARITGAKKNDLYQYGLSIRQSEE
jgi:16S rRNA (cytidine1402-2'-O)-methyltransferase